MFRIAMTCTVLTACVLGFTGCEKESEPEFRIVLPEVTVDETALAELPESHAKLIGTTWKVGEYTARFLGPDTVYIGGAPLAEMAPEGLVAEYTLEDGIITVTVAEAEQTKAGTWDGEKLVVDGVIGVMLEE